MRYFKTGIIALMFLFTHSAAAEINQYNISKGNKVVGTIVKLDKEKGVGVLKQERSDKLVQFRFADNFREKDVQSLKVGHVVEFTYSVNTDNVAALD